MERNQSEKGLTLVEVLLSMLILTIVFLSVMKFFPQMGLVNNQNEDKNKAINIAKEVLIDWQESGDVQWFVISNRKKDTVSDFSSPNPKVQYDTFTYDLNYYNFITTKDNYTVEIKINREPITESKLAGVYSIVINLKNTKGNDVATAYGFIQR